MRLGALPTYIRGGEKNGSLERGDLGSLVAKKRQLQSFYFNKLHKVGEPLRRSYVSHPTGLNLCHQGGPRRCRIHKLGNERNLAQGEKDLVGLGLYCACLLDYPSNRVLGEWMGPGMGGYDQI